MRNLRTTDYKLTPVIMLTGVTDGGRKAEGIGIGVVAWIAKPFQPQQLIDAIREVVPL